MTRSNGCQEDDAHSLSLNVLRKISARLHARMDCIMCVYLNTYVDCAAKLFRHTTHTKRTGRTKHISHIKHTRPKRLASCV